MDRRSHSLRWPAVVASLALALVAVVGCKSGLESLAIFYEGFDVPAECDGLKGKTVAVVCNPLTGEEFSNAGAARALSEGICERLKANVKKIHIIDPQKVADLHDNTGIEDYIAIGKKLKADKVVGIDIESFGVRDGQTLFRGRATVSIKVYDVAEKNVEWHKSPPQYLYPRIGSTPAQDLSEMEFRNRFVAVLSDQIARLFYSHDRNDDCGSDTPTP